MESYLILAINRIYPEVLYKPGVHGNDKLLSGCPLRDFPDGIRHSESHVHLGRVVGDIRGICNHVPWGQRKIVLQARPVDFLLHNAVLGSSTSDVGAVIIVVWAGISGSSALLHSFKGKDAWCKQ